MSKHIFNDPVICLLTYYSAFLEEKKVITAMAQTSLEIVQYREAFANLVSYLGLPDKKTKYQKAETAIKDLLEILNEKLPGIMNDRNKDYDFHLKWNDLGLIAGHNSKQLNASTDMVANIMTAISNRIETIAEKQTKATTTKVTEKVVEPVTQKTDNRKPSYSDVSKAKLKSRKVHQQGATSVKKNNKAQTRPQIRTTPTLSHPVKEYRLYIRVGDYDVDETTIKKWAEKWSLEDNKITITQVSLKSYVAVFKTKSREFYNHIPPEIHHSMYKSTREPVDYRKRLLTRRLYIKNIAADVPQQEIVSQLHYVFSDVDNTKTKIVFLKDQHGPNGKYDKLQRAYVVLVSSKNGVRPTMKTQMSLPFACQDWLQWAKPPRQWNIVMYDQYNKLAPGSVKRRVPPEVPVRDKNLTNRKSALV